MKSVLLTFALFSLLSACTTTPTNDRILGRDNGKSQIASRAYQSRTFTTPPVNILRSIVITLQDQGYVIDRSDKKIYVVTASKVDDAAPLRLTVILQAKSKDETLVRIAAVRNGALIEDPRFYQIFFNALENSLFLQAQRID